ncbi:hypothetical protein [Methylobacter sp. BBA5.1]|jgi:hypothetical protein|uniref:hypothetical protein n=1 Tax=Methylobacter sp. BBA5.1 TaxID=1495064 RepID=UPI00055A9584|nr:hypothetical protein [Methylobacter sp. BBA5.1]
MSKDKKMIQDLINVLQEMVNDYGYNRCNEKRLETIGDAKKLIEDVKSSLDLYGPNIHPSLKLITLSSGDCGLVLNDRVIMTADPNFEPVDQVQTAGFNLANAFACDISVISMLTPPKDDWNWSDVLMLLLNPDLKLFRVSYHDKAGDKTNLHFDCFATCVEHAMEQAEDAYPGAEILHATTLGGNTSQWSIREAIEQARAALPDWSFAKSEGVDPALIQRINDALSSDVSDDQQLKSLLIECRSALPIAWQNHGGCSEELLNSIDLAFQG